METEVKSGMYGQMPIVKIGKFTIAMMSNKEDETKLWIEDTEGGEGQSVESADLEAEMEIAFNRLF